MNNYYKKKANKYKYKYLKLKELYAGGRKMREPDEPDKYLYHGTTSFYIDGIQKNGLQKYPVELFKPIKKFWDIIKNGKNKRFIINNPRVLRYVPPFIQRNDNNDDTPFQISLTPKIDTAKEYAVGERIIGEGPTFFNNMLNNYLKDAEMKKNWKEDNPSLDEEKRDELLIEMKKLNTELTNGSDILIYSPLILAINVKDIPENPENPENYEINKTEYVIYEPIKADKLYIYIQNTNKYIKLNSTEGKEYVNNIKKIITQNKIIQERKREKLKREREQIEQLEQLKREREQLEQLEQIEQIEQIEQLKRENIQAYIDYINETYKKKPKQNNIFYYEYINENKKNSKIN